MGKSATSFKPGKSGNPGGRPKGVRSLTKLIDSLGDESCSEGDEDFRTTTIRRLWEAAATGRLTLGQSSQQLKAEQWIDLVQWLIKRTDDAALEHWRQTEAEAEATVDVAKEMIQALREVEAARTQRLTARSDDAINPNWAMLVDETMRKS